MREPGGAQTREATKVAMECLNNCYQGTIQFRYCTLAEKNEGALPWPSTLQNGKVGSCLLFLCP